VEYLKSVLLVFGSILLALLLTIAGIWATASLFDAMNWPLFHTWGLAHGSILFIFPVYFILSLLGMYLVARFLISGLKSRQNQNTE